MDINKTGSLKAQKIRRQYGSITSGLLALAGLSGGPLEGEYELWQFHAHWGKSGSKGSEHTIDGKQWDAEVRTSVFFGPSEK